MDVENEPENLVPNVANDAPLSMSETHSFRRAAAYLGFAIVAGLLSLLGGHLVYMMVDVGKVAPEIALPLLLVLVVIALLFNMSVLLALMNLFGLTNKDHALGLPQGTIRAVISLLLLFIFAILSIFLYREMKGNVHEVLLTENAYQQLQTGTIEFDLLAIEQREDEPAVSDYRVLIHTRDSDNADRFASQTLTTIAILVVALSSFYFGSRASGTLQEQAEWFQMLQASAEGNGRYTR